MGGREFLLERDAVEPWELPDCVLKTAARLSVRVLLFKSYAFYMRKRSVLIRTAKVYNLLVMDVKISRKAPPVALDLTFSALSDPTRRAILARLALGEDVSVAELAEPFAMSQPAISKHLKVLERAGLITRGREAQRRPCKLEAGPLAEATAWMEGYREFWERNYKRLDALLDEMHKSGKPRHMRKVKGEE
jgi:DNA-binding transcriptional ArsR family regulator